MGRIRRRRTRDISSPVTDGFVSCSQYAQAWHELSPPMSCARTLGEHRVTLTPGATVADLASTYAFHRAVRAA
jgi:hypothetical protein